MQGDTAYLLDCDPCQHLSHRCHCPCSRSLYFARSSPCKFSRGRETQFRGGRNRVSF